MNDNVVDAGRKSFTLSFRVPTKGMMKGETRVRHLPGEHVLAAAMVSNPDVLNPKKCKITWKSGAGDIGVTLIHKRDGNVNEKTGLYQPMLVSTNEHVYHADINDHGVPINPVKFHAMGVHEINTSASFDILPSTEQKADHKRMTEKKVTKSWAG